MSCATAHHCAPLNVTDTSQWRESWDSWQTEHSKDYFIAWFTKACKEVIICILVCLIYKVRFNTTYNAAIPKEIQKYYMKTNAVLVWRQSYRLCLTSALSETETVSTLIMKNCKGLWRFEPALYKVRGYEKGRRNVGWASAVSFSCDSAMNVNYTVICVNLSECPYVIDRLHKIESTFYVINFIS